MNMNNNNQYQNILRKIIDKERNKNNRMKEQMR